MIFFAYSVDKNCGFSENAVKEYTANKKEITAGLQTPISSNLKFHVHTFVELSLFTAQKLAYSRLCKIV